MPPKRSKTVSSNCKRSRSASPAVDCSSPPTSAASKTLMAQHNAALLQASVDGNADEVRRIVALNDTSAQKSNGGDIIATVGAAAVVDLNAESDHPLHRGRTALSIAAEKGFTAVVDVLLTTLPPPPPCEGGNGGAAHTTAPSPSPNVLDLNASAVENETPLTFAIRGKHAAIVTALLAAGASVACCKDGWGPMIYAALGGSVAVTEALLRGVAERTKKTPTSDGNGDADAAAAAVIRAMVNPPPTRELLWVPLNVAASGGHHALVRLFIAHGGDVNRKARGETPLFGAVSVNCPETVEVLLANGAQPNDFNASGETALMVAVQKNFPRVVEALLGLFDAKGAVAGSESAASTTRAVDAVVNTNPPPPPSLLLDVNLVKRPLNDPTPLHIAAAMGHVEIVRLLLETLGEASSSGSAAVVAPINVNATSGGKTVNNTPLFLAAANGHAAVVEALLSAGADMNAPNGKLGTPLAYARAQGKDDVVRILTAAGAHL